MPFGCRPLGEKPSPIATLARLGLLFAHAGDAQLAARQPLPLGLAELASLLDPELAPLLHLGCAPLLQLPWLHPHCVPTNLLRNCGWAHCQPELVGCLGHASAQELGFQVGQHVLGQYRGLGQGLKPLKGLRGCAGAQKDGQGSRIRWRAQETGCGHHPLQRQLQAPRCVAEGVVVSLRPPVRTDGV